MPDIVIRLATPDEAALLPDIERSAGTAFLSIPGLEWIASEGVMSAGVHRIHIDEGTVWVAISAACCIGFLTAAQYGRSLHIVELSVADGHQGKGVGRRLMETAKEYAEAAGLHDLTLTTFRDLSFNEHFYQKLGFQTLDEADLPQRLADLLLSEVDHGLPGDRRCAMRLTL
ncbi:N-acetyltransferase family protein [Parasphingorhabdus sp.]|uniref:GNAT family N-acetyltransferase n=1 Tax=Parasphingorhabdus sp. TaxID=2709688 RepID=UPI0035936C3F